MDQEINSGLERSSSFHRKSLASYSRTVELKPGELRDVDAGLHNSQGSLLAHGGVSHPFQLETNWVS